MVLEGINLLLLFLPLCLGIIYYNTVNVIASALHEAIQPIKYKLWTAMKIKDFYAGIYKLAFAPASTLAVTNYQL